MGATYAWAEALQVAPEFTVAFAFAFEFELTHWIGVGRHIDAMLPSMWHTSIHGLLAFGCTGTGTNSLRTFRSLGVRRLRTRVA